MPYLGNTPSTSFATVVKDSFSGDGSTVAFTLSKVATTNSVSVFVENVRQEPTTAYAVSGTTLTFTAAPVTSSGNNIYVLHMNPTTTTTHPSAQALTATSGTFSAGVSGTTGTFTSDVSIDGGSFVFNESSADKDFRVESNGNANMLFVDGGNDRVGIGGTPSVNLHIVQATDEGTPSFAGATHFAVQATASSSDNCNIAITSGSAGTSRIMFGDKDDEDPGKIEYNNNNNDFKFFTFQQEKLKIQENGTHVFTMKDTDGGTETAIWGAGTNSYIQGVSGEIYARDSAGNNTLLSPHRFEYIPDGASEEGAWAYLSKKSDSNIKTEKDEDGKDVSIVDTTEAKDFTYVNVDMMKVVREVEKLTGTKLVYTGNQNGDDGSTIKDDIIAGLIKRIEALESK
jgi:prepilin-type processing-associated H-X9-DG protein